MGGGGPEKQRVHRGQLLGRREPLLLESVPATKNLAATLSDLFSRTHRLGTLRRMFFEKSSDAHKSEITRSADQV